MADGHAVFKCAYERALSPEELAEMMAEAPDQVHWAPGQDGITGYWFEVTATVPPASKVVSIGAFYVRADSEEAAQRHAVTVLGNLGEHFKRKMREASNG